MTARSPHSEVVRHREEPAAFARRIVNCASAAADPRALFDYLNGTGREIADKIPAEILRALRQVAARVGDRPPMVLIVSADP